MTIIGYDAKRIVRNATGLGSYCRTLVNSLAPLLEGRCEMRLYAPDKGRDDLRSQVNDAPNMTFVYPQGMPFRLQRDLWRTGGIVKDLVRDGVSIYHGLSGELPRGLRKAGIHGIVTIHDLIFMRHPEYYNRIDVEIYKRKFRLACREAERIVAISECTKNDIMALGGVESDRIDVIYQSCGTRFKERATAGQCAEVRQSHILPSRYILNVGTIEERKNVMLAVESLQLLPANLHLVIVGRRTKYTEKVMKRIAKLGLQERVHILGGISNNELPAIYQSAEVFVYPSRYEGFGLPIIEAIQSGLPVVACTGSCLEEAGGPDCLYVSPDDANGMAEAVSQSLRGSEFRDSRIANSMRYVERFENTDVARHMIEEYKNLSPTLPKEGGRTASTL